MPDFRPDDIDIDPIEFVDACTSRERQELIDYLVECNYITEDQRDVKTSNHGVRNPSINDEFFWESLDNLKKCRHLLSSDEESYINNIADKFKHLV
jgi:hypothetical protein